MQEKEHVTLQDVEEIFDSFLLLADRDVIRLMLASIIGNQMTKRFPIWVMFVAPPSSGKTTLLNSLLELKLYNRQGDEIDLIHSISDLTVNSFASGMSKGDRETSLLHRFPHGGIMIFKDFTSILSKRGEEKTIIMGQLREIYDGAYIKRTGNANDVVWKGKVGALAGVTQAVYQHLESMSVMGDRFMFYQIEQPDRKKMLKFKIDQEDDHRSEYEMMPKAKELVHTYLQQAFSNMHDVRLKMDKETQKEIIDVADFCTMVRSGIVTNEYTQKIIFVPEPEMPARMFDQMMGLASAFALMHHVDSGATEVDEWKLTKKDFELLYKIAFDSIPIVRRIALRYLTQYKNGVDTAGLATKINYPTEVVRSWLEQLNALGVVDRVARSAGSNYWKLVPEYRNIMAKLMNIEVLDDILLDDEPIHAGVNDTWEADRMRILPDSGEIQEMEDNDTW